MFENEQEIVKGVITKGIGGFYYVQTETALFECGARGVFRNENISPLVGDSVNIRIADIDSYTAQVIEILPRRNVMDRPKVANIDNVIITFAAAQPKINIDTLDKFIIIAEDKNIGVTICINKIDTAKRDEIDKISRIYEDAGYVVVMSSVKDNIGIDDLSAAIKGLTSVFAGPSGVGKSSIINKLVPSRQLKTGVISKKIERGKHTTREATLLKTDDNNDTYIVDTPGFTSLSIEKIELENLAMCFREFRPFIDKCKFAGCSHINEPECGVKEQVGNKISGQRYNRYVSFFKELEQLRRKKYD